MNIKFKAVIPVGDMELEFCFYDRQIDVGLEGLYAAEVIEFDTDDDKLLEALEGIEFFTTFCDLWIEDYKPHKIIADSLTVWYATSDLQQLFGIYAPTREERGH